MFSIRRAAVLLLTCLILFPLNVAAWDRGDVERFATLPAGFANPEGLTVDNYGNVYATTFAVTAGGQPGQLFVFDPNGRLLRQKSVAGSSNLLLGLAFHPQTGELLVLDFGNPRVLSVNPFTGAATVFATIPGGGAAGPNALTFDKQGNVYISDSFQGVIWRTDPNGGNLVRWVDDDLLRTSGTPPFGANGLGFNKDSSALFVANTGNDQIIRIPVAGGKPGTPEVFTNSVNGADGLIIDRDDNLWVAANQADEIAVIDKTGKVIAKLGDFGGIDRHGAPIGFMFPASPARHGDWIYVTNLALDIRLIPLPQAVDSQWAAKVTSHTIARIRARIPRLPE
ncbi:MAG: SMP-30/gluconolactonase/LRE family protein [Burkholderiales bacterium]